MTTSVKYNLFLNIIESKLNIDKADKFTNQGRGKNMKHLKFLAVASFMAGLLSCTVEIPEVKVIEKASAENGCPTDKIKVLKTT